MRRHKGKLTNTWLNVVYISKQLTHQAIYTNIQNCQQQWLTDNHRKLMSDDGWIIISRTLLDMYMYDNSKRQRWRILGRITRDVYTFPARLIFCKFQEIFYGRLVNINYSLSSQHMLWIANLNKLRCESTTNPAPVLSIVASSSFSELTKNVIRFRSSHGHSTPFLKISCTSVQPFARNLAYK